MSALLHCVVLAVLLNILLSLAHLATQQSGYYLILLQDYSTRGMSDLGKCKHVKHDAKVCAKFLDSAHPFIQVT